MERNAVRVDEFPLETAEMRTLLVEDDAGSRLLLLTVLGRLGHDVSAFDAAEPAWELCREQSFDLAVLDWLLPGMDGLELCRRIRTLPWGNLALILVVTSCNRAEDLNRVLEAGADDFLAKPVNPDLLEVRLKIAAHQHVNLVRRKQAEDELQQAHDELENRVARRTAELSETVAALQRSEENYRNLVETINEIVFSLDTSGHIRYISPVMERLTGHSLADLVGKPFSQLLHEEDVGRLPSFDTEPSKEESYDLRMIAKQGRMFHMRASFAGVKEDDKLIGISGMLCDFTERRELEERLRLAQKMEVIGQFASGIAHDFNNLTMMLLTATDLIRNRLPDDEPLQDELSVVDLAAEQAADLSRAMLSFARKESLAPADLDLNTLIHEMAPILKRLLPANISLRHVPGRGFGFVRVDRARIGRVIMNLCANARDAMPEGGSIIIETGVKQLSEAFVARYSRGRAGRHVMMSVRDTGAGMDPETLSKVFDPFFTTKAPGKGTGLGLVSVYNAIEQHNGMIDVSSVPGVGTNFRVYLPEVEPAEVQPNKRKVRAERAPGHETVLIVDDCEEMRSIMSRVLESEGYHVLAAADGQQALEQVGKQEQCVELVISDVSMPHMNGVEFYHRCRELHPEVIFLLCSGLAADSVELALDDEMKASYLQKPFSADTLATKIRSMLDT
jgi:PAS domain S-box-containing protein